MIDFRLQSISVLKIRHGQISVVRSYGVVYTVTTIDYDRAISRAIDHSIRFGECHRRTAPDDDCSNVFVPLRAPVTGPAARCSRCWRRSWCGCTAWRSSAAAADFTAATAGRQSYDRYARADSPQAHPDYDSLRLRCTPAGGLELVR